MSGSVWLDQGADRVDPDVAGAARVVVVLHGGLVVVLDRVPGGAVGEGSGRGRLAGVETVASERMAVDIGVGIRQQQADDGVQYTLGHEGIEVVCLRLAEISRIWFDGVRE